MKITKNLKKDTIITKDSALVTANAIVDEIAKGLPGINIAWGLSKALYGAGLKLRQQKSLEWVEMVRDNPSVFSEHLFADESFQDGFVMSLEQYLTARVKAKRIYLRKVFLGFAKCKSKDEFELERLNDTYLKISLHAIKILQFIKTDIVPYIEKDLEKEKIKNENLPVETWKQHSLSGYITKWIHETYNPTKEFSKAYENETEIKKEIFSGIDELASLGILKINVTTGLGGMSLTSGVSYGFSNFGFEFIEYVDKQSKSNS